MKRIYNKPDFECQEELKDVLMASGDGVQENNGTVGDLLDGETGVWGN